MRQNQFVSVVALITAVTVIPELACAAPQSAQDRSFVRGAAQAGMAEVELARLALRKSDTVRVVSFATRMRDDHSKANAQLKSIAIANGFALPSGMGPKNEAEMRNLQSLDGHAFDSRYLSAQLRSHRAAIALFKAEVMEGKNVYLVSFAQRTLPTLEQHLFVDERDIAALNR